MISAASSVVVPGRRPALALWALQLSEALVGLMVGGVAYVVLDMVMTSDTAAADAELALG